MTPFCHTEHTRTRRTRQLTPENPAARTQHTRGLYLLHPPHGRQQVLLSTSRWVCGLIRSSNELLSTRGVKWAAGLSCSLRSSRAGQGLLQEYSKGAEFLTRPVPLLCWSLILMTLVGWSMFKHCPPGICSGLHVLGGVILPLTLTPTH